MDDGRTTKIEYIHYNLQIFDVNIQCEKKKSKSKKKSLI